jgi:hypothetical protein
MKCRTGLGGLGRPPPRTRNGRRPSPDPERGSALLSAPRSSPTRAVRVWCEGPKKDAISPWSRAHSLSVLSTQVMQCHQSGCELREPVDLRPEHGVSNRYRPWYVNSHDVNGQPPPEAEQDLEAEPLHKALWRHLRIRGLGISVPLQFVAWVLFLGPVIGPIAKWHLQGWGELVSFVIWPLVLLAASILRDRNLRRSLIRYARLCRGGPGVPIGVHSFMTIQNAQLAFVEAALVASTGVGATLYALYRFVVILSERDASLPIVKYVPRYKLLLAKRRLARSL